MTRIEQIIWCAGFFDGEGCVSISKPVTRNKAGTSFTAHQLVVIVAQRDRRPLDVFVSLFGGNVRAQKANNGSTYWYYRLHSHKAVALLQTLLPFLVCKVKAAECALTFQDYMNATVPRKPYGRTTEQKETLTGFYEAMRSFNVRNKLMDYTAESNAVQ